MNSRHFIFGALSFLLAFSSCKKNITPVSSSTPTPGETAAPANLEFKYFNARGRMQVEDEGDKITTNINIRMRKDSIIWISIIPALGIEAARIRLTQDSVYMLNRLKKEYFAGDYSFIKQKYKVDVTFDLLQAILLGNYMPATEGKEKIIDEKPLQHSRQEQANLLIDQFIDLNSNKLKKITIKDQDTKNSISVDYSQFEQIENRHFAKAALIVVQQGQAEKEKNKDQTKGAIASIDYNRINLNESAMAFPFSVPSGYKRQ
ncbi:MAG: DUF4292 domain-containing protein [Adhaeribacter sp.]